MIWVRSFIFALGMWAFTPLYFFVAFFSLPLDPITRYRAIAPWARIMLRWLKLTCGLTYRVVGRENIPQSQAIVLSKHQSAWETLAFQEILPPLVWVLKRELLRIPFFGWALAIASPIAIDRGAGRAALKQILEQGKDRLAKGFWVVIFPEGTRVRPGKRGKYNIGGAWLATHSGTLVVPVAHNAGEFWGKNGFLKRPGTITISFGPVIDPAGMKPDELNVQVEAWIEAEMLRIASGAA
jgi:1-acyl-sn-glycerol-3-phosphate acyltransferase